MRKVLLVVAVALVATAVVAPPASAVTLVQGDIKVALTDASSLYVDGVPRAPDDVSAGESFPSTDWADTTAQVGDELRVLFNVDSIQPGGNLFDGDERGTLTGMVYDLELVEQGLTFDDGPDGIPGTGDERVTDVDLYFAPLGRNPVDNPDLPPDWGTGGVMEVWFDPTPQGESPASSEPADDDFFNPVNGLAPQQWGEGDYAGGALGHDGNGTTDSAPDTYPEVNASLADGASLWLQAVFVPLGLTPGGGLTYVWKETIDLVGRSGLVEQGFLEIVGGTAEASFDRDVFTIFDLAGDVLSRADISVKASLALPRFGNIFTGTVDSVYDSAAGVDGGNWAVLSDDPIRARIVAIPEPASLSLLGLSLAGLLVRRRRKR